MSTSAATTSTGPAGPGPDRLDGVRVAFAVLLLVLFLTLITVLFLTAARADETQWARQVYLLGGVEAIVFTAVGWLFGKEVHRREAQTAQQDAAEAQRRADDARTDAQALRENLVEEQGHAAAEREKVRTLKSMMPAAAPAPPPTPMPDGGGAASVGPPRAPRPGATPPADVPSELRRLVDALWPD